MAFVNMDREPMTACGCLSPARGVGIDGYRPWFTWRKPSGDEGSSAPGKNHAVPHFGSNHDNPAVTTCMEV